MRFTPLTLLLSCHAIFICSVTAATQNEWWQPSFRKGMELFEQGNLSAAEAEFQGILDRDKKIPQAYYGLGLVHDRQRPGGVKAIEALERALYFDEGYAEAYYQLALIKERAENLIYRENPRKNLRRAVERDPHFIAAWEKLAECTEKVNELADPAVLSVLAEAAMRNPDHKQFYRRLVDSAFWYGEFKEMLPVTASMRHVHPGESEYPLDLANAYYLQGERERCLALLDTIAAAYATEVTCHADLLRAKIYFDSNRDEEGLEAYWRAVAAIRNNADVELVERDLLYLMNDQEFTELQFAALEEIPHTLQKFWRSRDPNLETLSNERIPEHYRRLLYARTQFRRYVAEDNFRKFTTIYRPQHERGTPIDDIGDRLLNSYAYHALPRQREIDDMGIIYLRHGEPDAKIYYLPDSLDDVPLNTSWQYFARYDRPEMIFHFIKYEGTRGWIIESLPLFFHERGELGGAYALLDPTVPSYAALPGQPPPFELLTEVESENEKSLEVGMRTETSGYRFEAEMFDFPFTFLSFKGERDKSNIELYFGVEGGEVRVDTSGGDNCLRLSEFIGFYDDRWREVVGYNSTVTVPVPVSVREWIRSSGMQREIFSIPPGEYHFQFHLRDMISGKMGAYKSSYYVPDYRQDSLMLSDVILSGEIEEADSNSPFTKDGMALTPNMFRKFDKNEKIGLYYEIYNLTLSTGGETDYQLSWALQEHGAPEQFLQVEEKRGFLSRLFSKGAQRVTTSYRYTGSSRDEKMHMNFDVGERRSGKYDLLITVRDLIADAEARKIVQLVIK